MKRNPFSSLIPHPSKEGDNSMKKTELTLPELALIAGTRGMLGAGVALL